MVILLLRKFKIMLILEVYNKCASIKSRHKVGLPKLHFFPILILSLYSQEKQHYTKYNMLRRSVFDKCRCHFFNLSRDKNIDGALFSTIGNKFKKKTHKIFSLHFLILISNIPDAVSLTQKIGAKMYLTEVTDVFFI